MRTARVNTAALRDEHVQRAPARTHVVDRGDPVVVARDVEVAVHRGVADLGRDRGALVVEHVAEEHPRALGGEQPRLGRALTARGTGDERDLAVEPAGHDGLQVRDACRGRGRACRAVCSCRAASS